MSTANGRRDNPTLDDLLIALQKSISRVNRRSVDVPEGDARAIITGNLRFSLALRLSHGDEDKLYLDDQGGVECSINGAIDPDIGAVILEEPEPPGDSA